MEAEIVELASQLTAASARLIALVGEFDAAQGWREWGMRSTAHWLSWQCGLGLNAAREQVGVARALRELPVTAGAFAAGRLSYSKVRALTRLAAPETEVELAAIAEAATAAQVEQLLAASRRVSRTKARDNRRGEYVKLRVDDDGCLVGTFRLSPERGVLVQHALAAATGRITEPGSGGGDEPTDVSAGTPAQAESVSAETSAPRGRRATGLTDGLVVLAESYLAAARDAAPADERELLQLVVHTSVDALAATPEEATAVDPVRLDAPGTAATALHPDTARRLTCDCPAATMVEGPAGQVLHLGRRTRRIRGRLRRAVHARDRGRCQAPGCTERATQIHHLRHWAHGGGTCLPNLVSVCDAHHWLLHEGGWALIARPGGRWALHHPDLPTIEPTAPTPPAVDPLPYDHGVRPDAVTGSWDGSRLPPDPILTLLARHDQRHAEECSAEHHPTAPAVGAEPESDVACSAEHHRAPSVRPAQRRQPASSKPAAGRSLKADPFTFTHDDIERWAASVERMNREAKLDDAIWIDE